MKRESLNFHPVGYDPMNLLREKHPGTAQKTLAGSKQITIPDAQQQAEKAFISSKMRGLYLRLSRRELTRLELALKSLIKELDEALSSQSWIREDFESIAVALTLAKMRLRELLLLKTELLMSQSKKYKRRKK